MDQSENFEPEKKRSAHRLQQEQEGSTAPNRRLRYPQHQQQAPQQQTQQPPGVDGAAGAQVASYHQPTYGVPPVAQTGGYPIAAPTPAAAAATATGTNLAAMTTASYPTTELYKFQQEQQRQRQQQQQLLYEQQQKQAQQRVAASTSYAAAPSYPAADAAVGYSYYPGGASAAASAPAPLPHMPVAQDSYVQPRPGRLPADRPLIKLSVRLIDTYKHINTVYYQERDARRKSREKDKGSGSNNNGWDDDNYDYIITAGELFYGRYRIKERIGRGSFGQVVRAEDIESKREVAIKIIKSKRPFLLQAKTEIELLTRLRENDPNDEHNVVRLLTHFMFRNHQCLVFEMLSLNLYELLKNTQFDGVSLNLIRKFAKQVLKALSFLASKDVDIIHCDLKPENILLRHPKKSGIKVIDFGSSCHSNKRMYSYIQSRFYRSPEVMLGLPYTVAIDMWSLGCILVEMHTGDPLFSGADQFDQMQRIVKTLGMVPDHIMEQMNESTKQTYFEKDRVTSAWTIKQSKDGKKASSPGQRIVPSSNPIMSLTTVVTLGAEHKKYPQEVQTSARTYELFVDLVYKMLAYEPKERIKPSEALEHPFITAIESSSTPATS